MFEPNKLKKGQEYQKPLKITFSEVSGTLGIWRTSNKLVQYSNGQKKFATWMVHYSGYGLNSELKVCYSRYGLNNELLVCFSGHRSSLHWLFLGFSLCLFNYDITNRKRQKSLIYSIGAKTTFWEQKQVNGDYLT